MTKTEEKFYKTFDIKPVTLKDFNYNTLDYDFRTTFINGVGVRYPKITDRILLKLICIGQNVFDFDFTNLQFDTVDDLKNSVLIQLMDYSINDIMARQIKSLFEGKGEE